MKNLFLYILIIPLLTVSQNYNGPESVEYNFWGNNSITYFISNSSNGQILALDENGELSVFVNGINTGPHGLEFAANFTDSNLYACSGGRLYGFDSEGNEILNYNLNGSFLNGITNRLITESINGGPFDVINSDLFITDFSAKKLYRYDVLSGTHDEICSFTKNPNGVLWDGQNNRLLVVCWGLNAPIYEVEVENGSYSTLVNTGLSNLDGITMDSCGNYYVTAWSSNSLHKYSSDFSETEIIMSGLSNPADICYHPNDNIIGIPNSGNNTLDFVGLDCNNSTIPEITYNRNLIKTIDVLGREKTDKGFQLRIYDNGSVEKKYLLK